MAIVLDNAINKGSVQEAFKHVTDDLFPWHFITETAEFVRVNPRPGQYSFASVLFYERPVVENFNMFFDLIGQSLDALDTPLKKLYRVRLGLTTTYRNMRVVHEPHVDAFRQHKTLLIYLNDSDGPTLLYNEKYSEQTPKPDNFTIEQEINPVQGRVALFDGFQYHSSTTPVENDLRVVMNVNFI